MYPAGWESEAAPSGGACLADPAQYRPLVHAADGLDARRRRLAGARERARSRLTAYAFNAAADRAYLAPTTAPPTTFVPAGPVLTGSSVSAAVTSAAAAAVWYYAPTLSAHEAAAKVYDGALALPATAAPDFCLGASCTAWPRKQALVCDSIRQVLGGAVACPPPPTSDPQWPPTLVDAATTLATHKPALRLETSYGPTPCGEPLDYTFHADRAPWPFAFPCPEQQLYRTLAWETRPLPGVSGCDVCSFVQQGADGLFVGDIGPHTDHSPHLKLYLGKSVTQVSLGKPLPANGVTYVPITGINAGTTAWDRAELVGVIQVPNVPPISTVDQLPIVKK